MGQVLGYARTSTVDQVAGLESQVRDLEAAGCTRVFREQVSSVDAKRLELRQALSYLRDGDTFVVTKPDRLARSTRDLLDTVEKLQRRGIRVRILSMGATEGLDTSSPTAKLMLTVLGAVATFERELMLERQREGIAKAKAEGKYRGRKPTAMGKADEVKALHDQGVRPAHIAKRLGIARSSVYRALGT